MTDKDATRAQPRQSFPSNKSSPKHQPASEKPAGLKQRTKTPSKTPVADRYVVFGIVLQVEVIWLGKCTDAVGLHSVVILLEVSKWR